MVTIAVISKLRSGLVAGGHHIIALSCQSLLRYEFKNKNDTDKRNILNYMAINSL